MNCEQYLPNRTFAFTICIIDGLVVTGAVVGPSAAAIIKPLPDMTLALTQSCIRASHCFKIISDN